LPDGGLVNQWNDFLADKAVWWTPAAAPSTCMHAYLNTWVVLNKYRGVGENKKRRQPRHKVKIGKKKKLRGGKS
jgi:hypothetical protein